MAVIRHAPSVLVARCAGPVSGVRRAELRQAGARSSVSEGRPSVAGMRSARLHVTHSRKCAWRRCDSVFGVLLPRPRETARYCLAGLSIRSFASRNSSRATVPREVRIAFGMTPIVRATVPALALRHVPVPLAIDHEATRTTPVRTSRRKRHAKHPAGAVGPLDGQATSAPHAHGGAAGSSLAEEHLLSETLSS